MQYLVSEEQTNLISDLPSSHEQTVSCLEIKIDVDEMDDIMNSGEDRVHFQEEDLKTRLKETKVFPDFNDLKSDNIFYSKTREDSYNPSSNTEATVKEEEVDLKGKYVKLWEISKILISWNAMAAVQSREGYNFLPYMSVLKSFFFTNSYLGNQSLVFDGF